MADVDGDGRLDVVTGSDDCCDAEPGFHWFRRGPDGRYTAMPEIRVRAGAAIPAWTAWERFRMRVALVDWDCDGELDILATHTRHQGGLLLVHGPWDAAAEAVNADGEVEGGPAARSMLCQPVVADWDGDGLHDLIVADTEHIETPRPLTLYRVAWYRNQGPRSAPKLGARRELLRLAEGETMNGLSATDWDGDGRVDLIVATSEWPRPAGRRKSQTRLWVYPRAVRNGPPGRRMTEVSG